MASEQGDNFGELARRGADAFVAACGSDLWPVVKDKFARLLGRSVERLERSRNELTGPDGTSATAGVHRAVAEKLEDVLGSDRQSVEQLKSLLDLVARSAATGDVGPASVIKVRSQVGGPVSGVASTIGVAQGDVAIGGKIGKVEKRSKVSVPLFPVLGGLARAHAKATGAVSIAVALVIGGTVWQVSKANPSMVRAPVVLVNSAGAVSLAYDPVDDTLAEMNAKGDITLWNTKTDKLSAAFPSSPDEDASGGGGWASELISFNADGTLLAEAGRAGSSVVVWNVSARAVSSYFSLFSNYPGPVAVQFQPVSNDLFVSGDSVYELVDPESGQLVQSFSRDQLSGIWAPAFSPDGETLASGKSGVIALWDMADGKQTGSLAEPDADYADSIAYSADGRFLAASNNADPSIVIWNISTRQVVLTLNVPGGGGTVAFSPDGKSLAVVSSGGIAIYSLASLSA